MRRGSPDDANARQYVEYRPLDLLLAQERAGTVVRAKLDVSRAVPTEGTVVARLGGKGAGAGAGGGSGDGPIMTTIVLSGRPHMNRAMHGDEVAVEVSDASCVWGGVFVLEEGGGGGEEGRGVA